MNGIVRKYIVCLFFSFDLLLLVWLSEMIRMMIVEITSGSNPYTLSNLSIFLLWIFGIVPAILLSVWLINPLSIKKLLSTFDLAEKSLDKKKEKTDEQQPEKIEGSKMSENAKRQQDKEFQCDLTKLQVDFEFSFTMVIGVIAILYGLLSIYKDNFTLVVVIDILLCVAVVSLFTIYYKKEARFQEIKKKYRLFASHDSKTPRQ